MMNRLIDFEKRTPTNTMGVKIGIPDRTILPIISIFLDKLHMHLYVHIHILCAFMFIYMHLYLHICIHTLILYVYLYLYVLYTSHIYNTYICIYEGMGILLFK